MGCFAFGKPNIKCILYACWQNDTEIMRDDNNLVSSSSVELTVLPVGRVATLCWLSDRDTEIRSREMITCHL